MGLDIYEIVLEVEEEFDVRLPESDMRRIDSVGDLFELTLAHLRQQQPDRFAADRSVESEVWERLKRLLVHQLRLKPEQVIKSACFFYELGFQ